MGTADLPPRQEHLAVRPVAQQGDDGVRENTDPRACHDAERPESGAVEHTGIPAEREYFEHHVWSDDESGQQQHSAAALFAVYGDVLRALESSGVRGFDGFMNPRALGPEP